jgi:serine/threonine protein kinase
VESLLAEDAAAASELSGGAVVAAAAMVSGAGHSALTGQRLGAYQILGALGAGGMREIYRARDTRLGREVAITLLPRAFTADRNRLARLEREARVLASLNHPHIAAIYGLEDAPTEAGAPIRALVLELVEGETLADRIALGPLPVNEALAIARQIAVALEAAHAKGIVHRDLKPPISR